jgi:hypothetical protein
MSRQVGGLFISLGIVGSLGKADEMVREFKSQGSNGKTSCGKFHSGTIADLAASENIQSEHISEAIPRSNSPTWPDLCFG